MTSGMEFADPFPNAPGAISAAAHAAGYSSRGASSKKYQRSISFTEGVSRSGLSSDLSFGSRGSRQAAGKRDVPSNLNAVAIAERLRLLSDYEDQYRRRAADTESRARQKVREEAEKIESREGADVSGGSFPSDVTALEGEILQEVVLADQLRASEESREAQRDAQSSGFRGAARPPKLGEKPSPTSQLREALREADQVAASSSVASEELRAEVQQERAAVRQLEQRAWRAQNAVRASEAHEDLLQAHRKDLERKLGDVQAQIGFLTPSRDGMQAGVITEAQQLQSVEKYEAAMSNRARQSGQEELASQQVVMRLQQKMQTLEHDVQALWQDASVVPAMGNQEAADIRAILVAALPPASGSSGGHPATLDQLLQKLETQRHVVREELQIDKERGSGWQAREQERLDRIAKEIVELNSEAEANIEEASRYQAQMKALPRACMDVEDRLCEAADLRRENDVMRRQQSQWQKSQLRMLRLIEDMQRKRYRDVQSQATVAARLSELQRDLPIQDLSIAAGVAPPSVTARSAMPSYPSSRSPSPPKSRDTFGSPGDPEMLPKGASRLNSIWSDNVALQSKLRRLEDEREELIRSQENLIKVVKSKMPTIEQARANMRFAHAVGEPHFARRALGF
jgi:hypothetical protein